MSSVPAVDSVTHHERIWIAVSNAGMLQFAAVCVAMAGLLRDRDPSPALRLYAWAASIVAVVALPELVKTFYFQRRPSGRFDCLFYQRSQVANVSVVSAGMPSGHSAMTVFTSVALLYLGHIWTQRRPSSFTTAARYIVGVWAFASAILVILSRVRLRCHSWAQVTAGAVIGLILGVVAIVTLENTGRAGCGGTLSDAPSIPQIIVDDDDNNHKNNTLKTRMDAESWHR